jgi:peptidylglycine monooxygenase
MAVVTGTGSYMYEHHPNWAKLPRGQDWQGPSSIAVDSRDRVYVFQRGGPPILIFEREGDFVGGWPRRPNQLEDAHHIYISPDDFVYLADRDAHQVLKFTTDGELVMALGTRYRASLQAPFNHPSDTCVAPNGEIYISDGYGNSSVHRFSPDGEHIASFGSPGRGPGEFCVPHSIRVSDDGRVYVADRENNRVQVFTPEGQFLSEWTDMKSPMGVQITPDNAVIVTDQVPRFTVFSLDGEILARGRTFENCHNVFTNSRGDFYGVDAQRRQIQRFVKIT